MTASREEKYAKLDEWNNFKKYLYDKELNEVSRIKDGEIWWVAIGENIGVEINGKSEYFTRPVLVLKTLSPYGFMGLPLTTQSHGGAWYFRNRYSTKRSYFALSQARVFSAKRVFGRFGAIPNNELERIRWKFAELYS